MTVSPGIGDRVGAALINTAANNAAERWAIERALQSEATNSRGYDRAMAALQFAEIAERALLWLGFRLHRPTVSSV